MSTIKALIYATGITAISAVMLTIARGMPTKEQAMFGGFSMFIMAFIVMRFIYQDKK